MPTHSHREFHRLIWEEAFKFEATASGMWPAKCENVRLVPKLASDRSLYLILLFSDVHFAVQYNTIHCSGISMDISSATFSLAFDYR